MLKLLLMVMVTLASATHALQSPARAPEFSGTSLVGTAIRYQPGAPTLLVFWASWCPTCMKELPDMITLANSNPWLTVVGVNLDRTAANGLAVVKQRGIPYASVKDGELTIADQYQVRGTPTLVVINASGNIIQITHHLNDELRAALVAIQPAAQPAIPTPANAQQTVPPTSK